MITAMTLQNIRFLRDVIENCEATVRNREKLNVLYPFIKIDTKIDEGFLLEKMFNEYMDAIGLTVEIKEK